MAQSASIAPFVWIETGLEVALTQARAWTASFELGYSWAPDTHNGWLAGARISRLISGSTRSLTEPDLNIFIGGAAISIRGSDANLFSSDPPALSDIVANLSNSQPWHTYGAWSLGLELRVKNRISASVFVETIPALNNDPVMDNYLDIYIAKFQTLGAEVGFWF